MFVPGSEHLERLAKLGKELDIKTVASKRHQLDIFVAKFGELTLNELTDPMVMN